METPSARNRFHLLLAVVLAAVVTTVYIVYSVRQWNTFAIRSFDLGIFTQMYQGYVSSGVPVVPIKGEGFNLLGDHFHPLLVVLTPVFALWPHAFTLLVLQDVCFGVAAGIVTWIACRRLGGVSGVLVGAAAGFSWGLQYAVEAQFHEIALGVPLLAGAGAAILAQRWRTATALAMLLPFVKEDLGLTTAALGVVLLVLGRRRLGVLVAAWGAAWFLLAVFVVLPLLNAGGSWAYGSQLSQGGAGEVWLQPEKAVTVVLLLVATVGMVMRSPLGLVLLPTLAWRFVSGNESYWGPHWHYSAILMPIAFLAVVDGVARARDAVSGWERAWGRWTPPLVGAFCVLLAIAQGTPLTSLREPGILVADPRQDAIDVVLGSLPHGATVESDIALMNYLVDAHPVYWIGNTNPVPDYVVIGPGGGTPTEWGGALEVARALHPDEEFELVTEIGGYSVARRG